MPVPPETVEAAAIVWVVPGAQLKICGVVIGFWLLSTVM